MIVSIEDCEGCYIYVYELDFYFNEDMVKWCNKFSFWINWCLSVCNVGFGLLMVNIDGVFLDLDWYIIN